MTPSGYIFLGLTSFVACLVAVVTFAMLRFIDAARQTRHRHSEGERELMSAALQEAMTRLKAQERATAARAEASERLSEDIIASLTAGLLVAGEDGEVRILNPAARRMLDVADTASPEEIRRSLNELSLSEVIRECFTSGNAVMRRAVSLPQPRHGIAHVGIGVSPLFDQEGRVHGAICLFTDLTAVRDLEQQLHLKESLATVGELTAGIAHEFRNGLATIHGYSKLFDLNALPEAYRPYVQGIRAETESLSQVVTNFLTFARPAELVLSRVELRAIMERAADEFRADVRALNGDIVISGDFGVVDGDEVLLRQAFSNLLRNALDACAGASGGPRISIRSEIEGAQTHIAIDDNGPGIPPDRRERVFQPFFTAKRGGTGLGLALVQKIIVFHNGRVTAGAAPSGGARLQVMLPIVR
jgi:signal transduction histidine kinase